MHSSDDFGFFSCLMKFLIIRFDLKYILSIIILHGESILVQNIAWFQIWTFICGKYVTHLFLPLRLWY